MTDDIVFDFHELNKLAADLGHVPEIAGPLINSAVQFTSVRVKKAARASVKASTLRWKSLPPTIDYEVKVDASIAGASITSEIGYNKDVNGGKGARGNLREFGAPAQNTAPSNDLLNALEANKADFQHGLDVALEQAEKKAGL